MHSISKTRLAPDCAHQIVAAYFGSQAVLAGFEELTEGFFNAAYKLTLQDGLVCVLKIAPPPGVRILRYEKDILRTEVETLRLVRARTEMPVPEVLFHDDSRLLLPSPYYAMQFIPGEPLHKLRPTLSAGEQAAIDRQTGVYLRQMNCIRGTLFGYAAQPGLQNPCWRSAFDQLLGAILQDGLDAGVTLHLPYPSILSICQAHFSALDEVETPCLVHWDLWDGNIFVDPQRKAITGIIDFERTLWADPLMEANFGAFGTNPDFFAGYGMQLPLSPSQQTRRSLYNVYLYLIMVIECTYRQYATQDQETWARRMLAQELAKLT